MNGLLSMSVLLMVVSGALSQENSTDPLDCSEDEYNQALNAINPALRELYFPLLDETSGGIRVLVANENNVKLYIDCIIENKACTKLGKSLQHFVTDESGNDLCSGCQQCQIQRFKYILRELRCNFNDQADRIQTYVIGKRNIDIYQYFNLQNIVC
ncbi:uncharacterized protein [Procambarus clarkii]|uniref:uncharacterized protein n=1 Tax=Procambarus clarkii TaxID=6728 RepID=UPI001E672FF5|nr:uncharacterized protein LOC123768295 [Procambarus clarkii]